MKRINQVLGYALVLLGLLHMATTFRAFDALTGAAAWFFGAGMAMSLTGALNVLNATYDAVLAGVRWTSRLANVALTAFAIVAGVASGATAVELVVIVGLVGGATVSSMLLRKPTPL